MLTFTITREVIERLTAELIDDAETGVRSIRGGVEERVPPYVCGSKLGAPDLLVKGSSVFRGGDGLAKVLAADWPPGLGDPDGLSVTGSFRGPQSGVEQLLAITDGVGLGTLEVGVGIHAKPVAGFDEGRVGAVGVGGPGVDVADGGAAQAGSLDGLAYAADVAGERARVGTCPLAVLDARRRVAV